MLEAEARAVARWEFRNGGNGSGMILTGVWMYWW